jgi:hypothetical protein
MYSKGQILKLKARTKAFPLFVMVCDTGIKKPDRPDSPFEIVVLLDISGEYEPGTIANSDKENSWQCSNLFEMTKVIYKGR